ncbi:sulfite exporter TauE/SafE family protein [Limnobacter sp.]|uniref:sulfite exporter TauE/SafE family protein n=1 Tax=Limnobacter sp. TaxID=2003368 RepID=UPI003512F748
MEWLSHVLTPEALAAYVLIGVVAGFLAGLLGVGGGSVLVPALVWAFKLALLPPGWAFRLALGTSMATILFTSVSSVRSHHQHSAVLWPVVKNFIPGILLGTLIGTFLARHVSTVFLIVFFAVFMGLAAVQMFFEYKPKPGRVLPGRWGQMGVATFIGTASSLVAVGGGALTVPFLTFCNVSIKNAIGTASAMGFPIALGGTIGFVFNGWTAQGLPPGSLGFVYLPALVFTVVASVLVAPWGARAAHVLPAKLLRKVFAVVVLGIAVNMLRGVV